MGGGSPRDITRLLQGWCRDMAVVCGRRRCGKSRLLLQVLPAGLAEHFGPADALKVLR